MKQDSGLMGIFGLIGGITLLLVARRYVPDLANLILVLIGVCGVLLIILVSVVLYFALKKPKKTEEQKASDEINDIIKSGRKNLMGLRRMSMEIKHARARTLSTEICVTIERIFRTLKEKPDQISSLRPFFNYYLPTLEKILIKYKEIESSGVPTEEITQSTITCLEDIKMAMEKQYNNLFENDILDLTVEMEVLTQICKRDGLLTDADFESEKMM
ncbi:MAG: 5-bromo-4-chloroindolyl phosphate hydrolysis family protein [Lachnospiraceae bacterium]|nr:5-bromo-4-chloroindolyl phosphate hydrolysis family protein [Lachnospiraceae bacterium]